MAASVTLSSMISSVRRRANIENQTSFISDAEITEYLNAGLSALYDMLVQAGGQPWYRASKTFSTSGNTAFYSFATIGATDFYVMQSVDVQLGSNNVPTVSARPYMEFERNRYKFYPGWTYATPIYYRIQDSGINFIPGPSGTFAITLNYYPVFVHLVNGSDTFDGVNGWEEYAIWKAVADCRGKGDEDPSYALGKAKELELKIQSMSEQRDAGAPERMTETDSDYGWGDFGTIR